MRWETRRHRPPGSTGDGDLEGVKHGGGGKVFDKQRKLKSLALKLVAVLLLAVVSLTAICVPLSIHLENNNDRERRAPSAVSSAARDAGRRLLSWLRDSAEVSRLRSNKGRLKIGLLNLEGSSESDLVQWTALSGGEAPSIFHFDRSATINMSWADLFPEWIDEEEQWHTPKCPRMPMPSVEQAAGLDLVVAHVPCDKRGRSWSRDVVRLHIFLATGTVAANAGRHHVHVLLSDDCRPLPNLFTCNELVEHHDGVWMYKAHRKRLQQKLSFPVGSCELAMPLKVAEAASKQGSRSDRATRQAYVTILHSAQMYVCGAITLAQSIRMTGSTRDLVILVDQSIQSQHREGLQAAGWKVREIQRIRNPKAEPSSYNEWNYSKFRLWQLTQYEKLIFIDADIVVLRNIDFLFDMPEISATGNHESMFNSGVMVIEPSTCTFDLLIQGINEVDSYNGGDQGYLNEVYTWWHRLPKHVNFLKHFGLNDTQELQHRLELFAAEPAKLYAMHFLGIKPWLCFRDYDCNWNQRKLHEYANDGVHAKWWSIHDRMPAKLQRYCLLRSKQKASLEWDRRQAEAQRYEDEHWKIKIKDRRLDICHEEFCFWESMLWHWGEPQPGQPQASSS